MARMSFNRATLASEHVSRLARNYYNPDGFAPHHLVCAFVATTEPSFVASSRLRICAIRCRSRAEGL